MTNSKFEKLIIQLKDKLFRFAFSILKDSNDAQDAVQEVVLKLWKNKRLLDDAKNLESYCLNAVKNHCFDVLRKQKHHQNYLLANVHEAQEETRFDAIDLVDKLKQELHQLPDQQRMAIELKDFQGLEYEEVSEIMEQSTNTIRVHVSRGRKKLFEIFKEELANV
ncbi:RNA polymerase sigma factor [Draconibacterium sp. IB214405]|uniref:RNA polymerase sigma factor n=1 Tax=Draconibacterium sp. IB214405 TaxID=3097352 RepID=UPI002A0CFDBC|nr:RNA polymerase sigma factor [Draconibacterium sp. IB214405]MDX8341233.1 RNA polymerase sigma factor [Draconibacterium sp. IB214405]